MMNQAKRIVALLLTLCMLLGMIPATLAEDLGKIIYSDSVQTFFKSAPQSPDGETPQEDFARYEAILVNLKSVGMNSAQEEAIGRVFYYDGTATFKIVPPHDYGADYGGSRSLYGNYTDVRIYVEAVDGITFMTPVDDGHGHVTYVPLTPDTDGNYTLFQQDEIEASQTEATTENLRIYAVMNGNGSTASVDYASLPLHVEAFTKLCLGTDDDDIPQYEDAEFSVETGNIVVTNNTAIRGTASGDWTVNKYINSEDVLAPKNSDDVTFNYTVQVGHGTNHSVNGQTDSYVNYGIIDLNTMTVTDTITAVTDKNGNDVYPDSVIVSKAVKLQNGQIDYVPVSDAVYDENAHTVQWDADSLDTVEVPAEYRVGFPENTDPVNVKRNTTYRVTLVYPKAPFTYSLVETQVDFDFPNDAKLVYTLKDAPNTEKADTDDTKATWSDVEPGGNIKIAEHLFMNSTDTTAEAYSTFYSRSCGFGPVSYTLYRADADWNIIEGEGAWSREISMTDAGMDDGNGAISTANYSSLNNMIPAGNLIVVPNYDEVSADVTPVTSANSQNVPAQYLVEIEANKTTDLDLYLRYLSGGIVKVKKAFYDRAGKEVTSESLYTGTEFTFTLKNESHTYTLTLGPDGKGQISLPTGTYTVLETKPEDYVPYQGEVTVGDGNTVELGTNGVVSNYPAIARLTVSASRSDFWVLGDYDKTMTGSQTEKDATYQIQYRTKGSTDEWTTLGEYSLPDTTGKATHDLPRYNDDGSLREYRVHFVSSTEGEYKGTIKDQALTAGADSEAFDFENNTSLTASVQMHFKNTVNVAVQKTVRDNRTTPASVKDWPVTLNGDKAGVTDEAGKVLWTYLPRTDDNGNYIEYTISETADSDLWDVVYDPAATQTAEHLIGDTLNFNVINKVRMGTLKLVKKDSRNGAVLSGAKYVFYTMSGDTKLYLTSTTGDDQRRTLDADETKAEVFTTDASGEIIVGSVPSGHLYMAQEIGEPDDYYINDDPAEVGTLVSYDPDYQGIVKEVTDLKHPALQVEKVAVNQDNSGTNCTSKVPDGTTVTFAVYTKDGETFKPAYAADGTTAITVTATKNGNSFISDSAVLPGKGTYYLLETGISNTAYLVAPKDGVPTNPNQGYETVSGDVFYGPYNVTDKETVQLTAYDYFNEETLTVGKKDTRTNEAVTVENTAFRYRLAAQLDSTDTNLLARFEGWTTTQTETDAVLPAPATGKTWYFSDVMSGITQNLPMLDSIGAEIEYYAIEITPPAGYLNKVNYDGTQGHHVVKAEGTGASRTVTFADSPEITVKADKDLVNVWDKASGKNFKYALPGVGIALYSVDESNVLHFIASATTDNLGVATFPGNTYAVDVEGKYVVLEYDSLGYDYQYIPNNGTNPAATEDYPVLFDADALNGLTITDLEAKGTNWQYLVMPGANAVSCVASPSKDIENYNPYFQIELHKFSDNNKNGEKEEGENPLDICQFWMYEISLEDYNAAKANPDGLTAGLAAAISAGKATTDKYVYETGTFTDGTFKTVDLPYAEQKVYFFKEIKAHPGYIPYSGYVVVTPDDYKPAKNSLYETPWVPNTQESGGGEESLLRELRIKLDKYSDIDASRTYSEGDIPLANVTFTVQLVDKNRQPVTCEALTTFFSSGTDAEHLDKPGYAVSKTMFIDDGLFAALAREPNPIDPDTIFDFVKADNTHIDYDEYVTYTIEQKKTVKVCFEMLLTETEWPDLTTPYQLEYYLTMEVPGTGVFENIQHANTVTGHPVPADPILNASARYVFARVIKKTSNTALWVPDPSDPTDYVEFTLIPQTDDPSITNRVVQISAANYDPTPIVLLEPGIDYLVTETHAPKGYDKPKTNKVIIDGRPISSVLSTDEDERIATAYLEDTPFVTITVKKTDSAGQPVAGKRLGLVYREKKSNQNTTPLWLPNGSDRYTPISTTDENGVAVFVVPKLDYRQTNNEYVTPVAEYRIVEYKGTSGTTVETSFDVLNGTKAYVTGETDTTVNPVPVYNPESTSITLTKLGIEGTSEKILPGVNFKLYYKAFSKYGQFTAANVPTTDWTKLTAKKAEGTTGSDGTLTLNDLYSGFYRLDETVPAGYMYEGQTYSVGFVLVTPGDAANLIKQGLSGRYWADGKYIIILSQTVGGNAVSNGYNTAAAQANETALTVKNTSLARLDIVKAFEDSAFISTFPGTVSVGAIKKDTKATVAKTITIVDRNGSVYATDGNKYMTLEPGTYTVYEEFTVDEAGWAASYNLVNNFDTTKNVGETQLTGTVTGNKVRYTVGEFELTSANTDEKPVVLTLHNRGTKTGLKVLKVNNKGEAIKGAEFVLYYVNGEGKTLYYQQQEQGANGLGLWTEAEATAKHFISGADGYLDFTFYMDQANMALDGTADYTLREVKADYPYRQLCPDQTYTFKAGEKLEKLADSDKLIDYEGLCLDLTLFGHTKENMVNHPTDPTLMEGIVFELYRVEYDTDGNVVAGSAVRVDSFDANGMSVHNTTTDPNGKGYFHYLDPLTADNQGYVLVQKTNGAPADFWGTDYYFDAVVKNETQQPFDLTLSDGDYKAITVFQGKTTDTSVREKSVDVYNMPVSRLLLLKYDYEYPKMSPPQNAKFEAAVEGQTNPYQAVLFSGNTDISPLTEEQALALGYGTLLVDGKRVFINVKENDPQNGYVYAYGEMQKVKPGTYNVTETDQPEGYLFSPKQGDYEWISEKTIEIGDDGGLFALSFANVPNPKFNKVAILKEVESVRGTGGNGSEFGNLQDTLSDGTWQNITYEVSNFAPGKDAKGVELEYVKYPISTLEIKDVGLSFTHGHGTSAEPVGNVESYVNTVTVGVANYVSGSPTEPVGSLYAAVYGIKADGTESSATIIDVAKAENNRTVDFPAKTYTAFRIVYGVDASGVQQEPIHAGFKAGSVLATFEAHQGDDPNENLVSEVFNTASVKMGYDIGCDTAEVFTRDSTATEPAEDIPVLPDGELKKIAQVKDEEASDDSVNISGGKKITYTLTFTNKDLKLSIPDPFIMDVLPKSILPDTDETNYLSVTSNDPNLIPDDIVYNTSTRTIYVTSRGELGPGKTMTLTIKGVVDLANALNEYEEPDGITNNGYAGSTTRLPRSKQNPEGAPFSINGTAPSFTAQVEDQVYAAARSQIKHNLILKSKLTIVKQVAGEVTGCEPGNENWMSGTSNVAITNAEGAIKYRLTIKTEDAIEKGIRVADILPWVKQGSESESAWTGLNRSSGFKVDPDSGITVTPSWSVDLTGKVNVLWNASKDIDTYKDVMVGGLDPADSSWSTDYTDARGFVVEINSQIPKGKSITITFTCKAPKDVEGEGDNKVYNVFKKAQNDAAVYSLDNTTDAYEASNSVYVTILPKQIASVGDYVWLDKNVNGKQDIGEVPFTGIESINLRVYNNSNTPVIDGKTKPDSDGYYKFTGLYTAMRDESKAKTSNDLYNTSGDVIYKSLLGSTRYTYQLVVEGLQKGYVVTTAYAGTSGTGSTKYLDKPSDSGLLVYDADATDRAYPTHEIDSDFVYDSSKNIYLSRRFYLPIQEMTNPDDLEIEYLDFDIGVVRTRDLSLKKLGANGKTISGVKFKVYGPYDHAPTVSEIADNKLFATWTTNSSGEYSFVSTPNKYLNYYSWYLIQEDENSIGSPYRAEIVGLNCAPSTAEKLTDTVIRLNPAAEGDSLVTEELEITDRYLSFGSIPFGSDKLEKNLTGASVSASPFDRMFCFTITSNDDDQNILADKYYNNGSQIGTYEGGTFTPLKLSYHFEEPLTEPKVYTYTLKEVDPSNGQSQSLISDTSEYKLQVTVKDPNKDGKLVVSYAFLKNGDSYADRAVFDNTYKYQDLTVTKVIDGTPNAALTQYVITVQFASDDDRVMQILKNTNFTVTGGNTNETKVKANDAGKMTLTFKQAGSATIKGLPLGVKYTVSEENYTAYGFSSQVVNPDGKRTLTDNANDNQVTVTNTRNVGSLTVTKNVDGVENDKLTEYAIDVKLTYPTGMSHDSNMGNYPVAKVGDTAKEFTVKSSSGQELTLTFKLKKDETLTLSNLPLYTKYEVTEAKYVAYGFSSQVVSPAGVQTLTDEVAENKIEVTNTRKVGSLTVTKNVDGVENAKLTEYAIDVKLTYPDGMSNAKTDGNYPVAKVGDTAKAPTAEVISGQVLTLTFKLKKDETLTLSNLPLYTKYEVTEAKYVAYGFSSQVVSPAGVQTLTDKVAENKIEVTNTRKVGSLTVTKNVDGVENAKLTEYAIDVKLTYPTDMSHDSNMGNYPVATVGGTAKEFTVKSSSGQVLTLTFMLKKDETLTLSNLPLYTKYEVTEADYVAYGFSSQVVSPDGVHTLTDKVAENKIEVTNIRKIGSLAVTKKLTANSKENAALPNGYKLFIELNYPANMSSADNMGNYPRMYIIGGGSVQKAEVSEGKLKITAILKKDATLTLENLPAGTAYTVTEDDYIYAGYAVPDINNNNQTRIIANATQQVTVTNSRELGSLKLSKQVAGTGTDTVKDFEFTLLLKYDPKYSLDAANGGNLPVLGANSSALVSDLSMTPNNTNHTVTIHCKLKHGGEVTVGDILKGTAYVITEENYVEKGFVKTQADNLTYDNVSSRTGNVPLALKGEVSDSKQYSHQYTNYRNAAPLTVTKMLAGNATSKDDVFKFTVTLSRKDMVVLEGQYDTNRGPLKFVKTGSDNVVTATFELKGGESITIQDIPENTSYLVVEEDSRVRGYLTDRNDVTGTVKTPGNTEVFTNSRNLGALALSKKLGGNAPESTRQFKFTIKLTNKPGLPVAGTYAVTGTAGISSITFTAEGSDSVATAEVQLLGGQEITINDIYLDTEYEIKEDDYSYYGYVQTDDNAKGAVTAYENGTKKAEFTNTRNAGILTISKTVVAEGMDLPTDRVFTFTVNLKRPDGLPFTGTLKATGIGAPPSITFVNGVASVTLKHSQTITLHDILVGSAYEVTEAVYTDCKTTSTGESGVMTTAGAVAEFTNTMIQQYAALTVIKEWEDKDDEAKVRPRSITVKVSTQEGPVGTYTLNARNGWKLTLDHLPIFGTDGRRLIYNVQESGIPDGYKAVYSYGNGVITISNIYKFTPFKKGTTIINDLDVPLGGAGICLNEGYCFD